jgi:hypothetical protein
MRFLGQVVGRILLWGVALMALVPLQHELLDVFGARRIHPTTTLFVVEGLSTVALVLLGTVIVDSIMGVSRFGAVLPAVWVLIVVGEWNAEDWTASATAPMAVGATVATVVLSAVAVGWVIHMLSRGAHENPSVHARKRVAATAVIVVLYVVAIAVPALHRPTEMPVGEHGLVSLREVNIDGGTLRVVVPNDNVESTRYYFAESDSDTIYLFDDVRVDQQGFLEKSNVKGRRPYFFLDTDARGSISVIEGSTDGLD